MADPWRSEFTAVPRLENEGFQIFFPKFVGRYNYSGLRLGLRLPAFSFTITCGNLTVGHFRLQLHVAALHWDYVLNDGFPLFRLQMHVTTRFFSVGCPGSRGNLPESCSGKLTQGVTIGLKKPADEKHHWHSAEPVRQSGLHFGAYISCGFWHSGTYPAKFPVLFRAWPADCLILDIPS